MDFISWSMPLAYRKKRIYLNLLCWELASIFIRKYGKNQAFWTWNFNVFKFGIFTFCTLGVIDLRHPTNGGAIHINNESS